MYCTVYTITKHIVDNIKNAFDIVSMFNHNIVYNVVQ